MSPTRRWFRLRAPRTTALGVLGGLVLLLTGDSGVRSSSNPGIDPLEILNIQIKPNVFIVFDTSGSMRAPLDEFRNIGADDPGSRLFQAKDALRRVLNANATRVNFGFGSYNLLNNQKHLRFPIACDGFSCNSGVSVGAPMLYVSSNASADTWTGGAPDFFGTPAQGASYLGTGGADVRNSFTRVTRVFPSDVATPGTCTGAPCRRYLLSRLLRDNVRYVWNTAGAGSFVSGNAFVCPNPPAGLFPQDPNVDADPTTSDLRRPCVVHETSAGAQATFFYSSGLWDVNPTLEPIPPDTDGDGVPGPVCPPAVPPDANLCGGAALLNAVAPCDQNAVPTITNNYLKPELPVDGSCGEPLGFPCDVPVTAGPVAGTAILGANPSTVAGNDPNVTQGLIAGQATPLAASINYVDNNFNTVFPNQFPGQRNFLLILTDGDDTCAVDKCLTNAQRAVFAAQEAQQLYNRVPLNAETLVVAFTDDVNKANANKIAKAGSGATSTDNYVTDVTCPANVPCRDAYSASNATELAQVLNAAIQQTVNIGEFSDQQSITQSIYELSTVVESPTGSGLFPFNPMDPQNRYASVPVLLQSTFEMPDFKGHLKAFRRAVPLIAAGPNTCLVANGETGIPALPAVPTTCRVWDAAEELCQRVTGSANCVPPAGPLLTGTATFAQLHNNQFSNLPNNIAAPNPAAGYIARRIYTTTQNGVNPNYTANNLAQSNGTANSTGSAQVPLWPPNTSNSGVAPSAAGDPAGSLDGPLGLNYPALASNAARFAQLKADYGACVGTNLPGDCNGGVCSGACGAQFLQAKREAREMILAHLAGARAVRDANGNPSRNAGGEILYQARSWILAESTLAAPAVVPPPLQKETTQESDEYISFRDGPRTAGGVPVNGLNYGWGLRNPDNPATAADIDIKPIMTVVYHATNEMLHAFRAGPCPSGVARCAGENGGEELWGFVPFDLLGKLRDRMKPQSRTNHTYMLAAPVRFNDVFVRGAGVNETFSGATVTGDGVWRRVAMVGRGVAGKSLTAIDVTVPGQFTLAALATNPPIVIWNRGNPDTTNGLPAGPAVNAADTADYAKMGETWSVPTMSFVTAINNSGVEFMSYVASGYSDVTTEGKTFYALATLNGNVIASHDIANRAPAPLTVPDHALVASPSAYSQSVLDAGFRGSPRNPATEKSDLVFFPDIHSRVWRFVTDTPAAPPTLFVDLSATDGEQPVANGVTLAATNSDATSVKPHVYLEAGNDSRIPVPGAMPFFRMYGYRDTAGVAGQLFFKDFPTGFRGTVQPTGAFNEADPPQLRVFFAGTRFNPATLTCASSFDSIVFLLTGVTGGAAYDLTGDATAEESITMTGQRVTAISIGPEGQLIVDLGLGAQNPPAPPAPPSGGTTGTGSQLNVRIGTNNVPGAVPFRLGTTVCR